MCCNTTDRRVTMKKTMIAFAIMALTLGVYAGSEGMFKGAIAVSTNSATVGRTVFTNVVVIGGNESWKVVEKLAFYNHTTETNTVAVEVEDIGIWTALGPTITNEPSGTSISYPTRTVTETVTGGYVVTNMPVPWVSAGFIVTGTNGVTFTQTDQTNYYMRSCLAAVTTTTSKTVPVAANKLRFIATMTAYIPLASNTNSTKNTISWEVLAK